MTVRTSAPRPRGLPGLGHALAYRRDAPALLLRLAGAARDPVAFRVGPVRMLLVSRPEQVAALLERDAAGLPKAGMGRAERLIGQGLLTSHGVHHARQRRLAEAAFSPQVLAELASSFLEETERCLGAWTAGRMVELSGAMGRLTARVMARALFGSLADADLEAIADDLAEELHWLNRYPEPLAFLDRWPSSWRRRMRAARGRLRARALAAWRSGAGGPVLSSLRDARDPRDPGKVGAGSDGAVETDGAGGSVTDGPRGSVTDGAGMAEDAAIDEILTLLIAAHEPAAMALTWTCYRLAADVAAQDRLRAEVGESQDRPVAVDGAPSAAADLGHAASATPEALDRYFREALRLHPPIWVFARRAPTAMDVDGVRVSAGTWLMVSAYVTHRDAEVYPEPERFDPDRWLGLSPPRGAWLPFGWGPRRCLGEGLATRECLVVLEALLRRWRLRLPPGAVPPTGEATITLRPKGGLWFIPEPVAPDFGAGTQGPGHP